MTELKNRVILGLSAIFVLGIIVIYMGSPKISLKLLHNAKGMASVEITVTKFGVPVDGVVKVHMDKTTSDGHNCKKMLTIPVTGGKAVFKVWGKHGKASQVNLEASLNEISLYSPPKSKLSFEIEGKNDRQK